MQRKFFAIKDELPPHVKEMFDTKESHPDGAQKRGTDIINNCFTRKGGKWVVDVQKPLFQEAQKRYFRVLAWMP